MLLLGTRQIAATVMPCWSIIGKENEEMLFLVILRWQIIWSSCPVNQCCNKIWILFCVFHQSFCILCITCCDPELFNKHICSHLPVKKSFLGYNKSLWGPLEMVEKLCPEAGEIATSVRDLPGLKYVQPYCYIDYIAHKSVAFQFWLNLSNTLIKKLSSPLLYKYTTLILTLIPQYNKKCAIQNREVQISVLVPWQNWNLQLQVKTISRIMHITI